MMCCETVLIFPQVIFQFFAQFEPLWCNTTTSYILGSLYKTWEWGRYSYLFWVQHLCYRIDFLFAKSWGRQSYFRYTILNTQWTFCASMKKKFGAFKKKKNYLHFRKYMICVQLYGKWASWGCYNLYFEISAENVTLLSLNIIKLIPLDISPLPPCDYM